MVDTIHIHEDDWEMRSLYPLAARGAAEADMRAAVDAAERNRDPSGVGYTGMHVIAPPAFTYADAGLRLADAAAAIEPIMPRVRRFYATVGAAIGSARRDPMGSYEEDAWCFGLGEHCYVKLETDGETVKRIWFDLASGEQADILTLRKALKAVDALVPSILIDYHLNMTGEVGDQSFMADYLSAHRSINTAVHEEIEARAAAGEKSPVERGMLARLLRTLRGG